eukprot:TRINITY_DN5525_c0_g1_i7.p1 TRINITY_DN5525_c0_g1~~TRINITY_DN5525_c0_g1_i7.p1  ORF type:complete len:800 (-),score=297.11 TRINITY_DN5525_c0_g1_i7:580-2979(-)
MMISWNGELYAWGANTYNEVGPDNDDGDSEIFYPTRVRIDACVQSVSVSQEHSLFVTGAGQTWAIGKGTNGRTGMGNTVWLTVFTQIGALERVNITAVATGIAWSFAISANGTVYGFGLNNYGQLGIGTVQNNVLLPTVIEALAGITIVAADAGGNHSVFLSDAGNVYTCGLNTYGQLGLGQSVSSVDIPTLVNDTIAGVRIVQVASGSNFVLLLSDAGAVYGFGQNSNSQLGIPETAAQWTPLAMPLPGGARATSIAAGDTFTMIASGPAMSFPPPCVPQLPTTGIQPTTRHFHTTGSTGSTSTGNPWSDPTSTTSTGNPWLTTSTTTDPFATASDGTPANLGGIIAGCVVGGVVLIIALTVGLICYNVKRGNFRVTRWGWDGSGTTTYYTNSGGSNVTLVNTNPYGGWGGGQNFMFYGADGMPMVIGGPPPDYNDANYVDDDEDMDIPPEIMHMINTYGYARFELEPDSHAYSKAKLHIMEGLQLPHPDYPNIVFSIEAIDFVYNPTLEEAYEQCRQKIMAKYPYDKTLHRERFAFHGCRPAVVPAICQNGLLHIGHPKNPSMSTDEGFFGDPHFGVYVSRYIHYTLKYSNGLMPLRPGDVTEIVMLKCIPAKELRFEKIEMGAKPHPDYDSHCSPNYLEWYLPHTGQSVPTHVITIKANKANRKLVSDDGVRNSLYQDEPAEGADRKVSKPPRKITMGPPIATATPTGDQSGAPAPAPAAAPAAAPTPAPAPAVIVPATVAGPTVTASVVLPVPLEGDRSVVVTVPPTAVPVVVPVPLETSPSAERPPRYSDLNSV